MLSYRCVHNNIKVFCFATTSEVGRRKKLDSRKRTRKKAADFPLTKVHTSMAGKELEEDFDKLARARLQWDGILCLKANNIFSLEAFVQLQKSDFDKFDIRPKQRERMIQWHTELNKEHFYEWALEHNITKATIAVLHNHNIFTVAELKTKNPGDIESMGLPTDVLHDALADPTHKTAGVNLEGNENEMTDLLNYNSQIKEKIQNHVAENGLKDLDSFIRSTVTKLDIWNELSDVRRTAFILNVCSVTIRIISEKDSEFSSDIEHVADRAVVSASGHDVLKEEIKKYTDHFGVNLAELEIDTKELVKLFQKRDRMSKDIDKNQLKLKKAEQRAEKKSSKDNVFKMRETFSVENDKFDAIQRQIRDQVTHLLTHALNDAIRIACLQSIQTKDALFNTTK